MLHYYLTFHKAFCRGRASCNRSVHINMVMNPSSSIHTLRRAHSNSAFDLLSCGSALVEIVSHVKKLPLANAATFHNKKMGQKELVTGAALHHLAWSQVLGVRGGLLSLQGADKYGDMIRETLRKNDNITDFMVQKEDFETSVCRTYVNSAGERCSIVSGGSMMEMPVNAIKLIFTEPVLKARSVSFEISNIPLASVEEMLDLANGALRFLDLAVLPSVAVNEAELGNWESLERCLSKCNVIKTTLQAAKELTNDPCASSSEIALHLREKFQVAYVAITDGVNGAVVAFKLPGGKHFASHIPLPSNFALTDAFGAEDAFYGGLIAGFCHWGLPEDIESATRIGKLAGATRAACCETLGGFPSDESYYRVQKFLPMGFPSGCNRIHPHPCKPLSIDQLIVGPIASLSRDIDALLNMRRIFTNLDYATHFQAFVSRIITCRENRNRVFTSGIGKSGIVAKRFASMLSSLSIPSHWIHGSEWTHGELGNLFPGDVVILISNSGKTPELLHLPEVFHGFNVDVMCVVGGEESPLYKQCDYKIFTPAKDCLFDSVPTRSIVAQEAICNAVAESVVSISGIKPSTFKKNHPGGNIGHMMFSPPPRRNSHPTTHHNL